MPSPRADLALAAVHNRIYAIGGWVATNAVEQYDPASDIWVTKEPMPTPRGYVSGSSLNGRIYVIGGADSSLGALDTVEVYDLGVRTMYLHRKD